MEGGIYLLLGSNLGDREANLAEARRRLRIVVSIRRTSGSYQSQAWGKTDQPSFLNQAVEITTTMPPLELLAAVKTIEQQMGRVPAERWAARLIDIDLLFYHTQVLSVPGLTVPHSGIPERMFTLIPLVEMNPGLVHPVTGKTMQELLAECKDPLKVERVQKSSKT